MEGAVNLSGRLYDNPMGNGHNDLQHIPLAERNHDSGDPARKHNRMPLSVTGVFGVGSFPWHPPACLTTRSGREKANTWLIIIVRPCAKIVRHVPIIAN